MIAGAGGFDGGVQGQEVGLIGNAADGQGYLRDVAGAPFQFANDVDRGGLALGVALDGADRGGDLYAVFGQDHLHRFGPAPRAVGLSACYCQISENAFDRRELFLRAACRFVGAAGDLLHGPPQLFRRGRRLGKAAGEFFGRRGEPF